MSKRGGGYNLCAALYCNHNRKRNPNLSFFRFPKNPKICRQWIINCKRFDLLNKDTSYLYANCILCSEHFTDTQFTQSSIKNRLTDKAIPTIFSINIKDNTNTLLNNMGEEICEQIEKQNKQIELAKSKNQKIVQPNGPMVSTSIFKKSKNLLTTKILTISTKPRIITTQVPANSPYVTSSIVTMATNTKQTTTKTINEQPRLIWLTGLPVNQNITKPIVNQNIINSKNVNQINFNTNPTNVIDSITNETLNPMTITNVRTIKTEPLDNTPEKINEMDSSLNILPECNDETRMKIPGTSDSTNDNYGGMADYSYTGSFDGSQYNSSVLQDANTNSNHYASYDNTYDTSYDDPSVPPPVKKKKIIAAPGHIDNLNDTYQAFSDLVVTKLKALPPNRAALLQLKIQELLSKEIIDLEGEDENEEDNEQDEIQIDRKDESLTEMATTSTENSDSKISTQDTKSVGFVTTTQIKESTSCTSITTIAKKRKSRPTNHHSQEYMENKENARQFLDESYKAFSKCIVSQLRYLPVPVAVKTQDRIQKVLSDEIINYYNATTAPSPSTSNIRVKDEPNDNNSEK